MKFLKLLFRTAIALAIVVVCLYGYNRVMLHLYPKDYSEYVEKYSREYGIDSDLVYAVIKCESNFDPKSHSEAGAVGLMQLTEATFLDIGKMLNEKTDFKTHAVDPEVNIKYGTRYLKYLYGLFDGDQTAVIAAYNAGLGRVGTWKGDDVLQVSEIEFSETKEYVNKVQKAQKYYKELYN